MDEPAALCLFCCCRFTTAFARRGLVAEHGSSWVLPRIMGTSKALDLLLSARVIQAQEACDMGMVNFVYPREQVRDLRTRLRVAVGWCDPSARLPRTRCPTPCQRAGTGRPNTHGMRAVLSPNRARLPSPVQVLNEAMMHVGEKGGKWHN